MLVKWLHKRLIFALLSLLSFFDLSADSLGENRLVILHTNDTHSQIDPMSNGLGGVARRKVIIDSVRATTPNFLLIDAGDAVSGSLYFTLFEGEVERVLMNLLGYDIRILGNHEFDLGMEQLAKQWSLVDAHKITTNYDLSHTPLDSIFTPFIIKHFGNRTIGFIAVNLDPAGIIFENSAKGVKYLDGIKAANATAWHLKHNEKVDLVIALTHIGYRMPLGISDEMLASMSEDIDIIIGGHSHTPIDSADPLSVPSRLTSLSGDSILIAQAGYGGAYVGEILIDLDSLTAASRLIPVDDRLDDRLDPRFVDIIGSYRISVDSIMAIPVAPNPRGLFKADWSLPNFIADIIADIAWQTMGKKVDFAIMNKGGIRCDLPSGNITEGQIRQMLPFDNKIVVLEIYGKDLKDAFDIMAKRGGEAVSRQVTAIIDSNSGSAGSILIDGSPIIENHLYTVATVDYLATGGDYLSPLENGTVIASSPRMLCFEILDYIRRNFNDNNPVTPDTAVRMSQKHFE